MQDPTRSEVVYAGTTEGLWRTVDAGHSWTRLTGANIIVNDILIDVIDSKKIMLATDRSGVLASSDWGNQFFASNRGFAHRQVSALLTDMRDPSTLYAGVINDKEFGGVFTSRDGGAEWQQMSSGLDGADVYVLQQNAKGDLFAGTNRGVFTYAAGSKAYRWIPLQVSTTSHYVGKGKSRKLVRPSAMNFRVNDLDISTDLWLAAGGAGLFTSTDHGKSWVGGPNQGLRDFIAVRRLGDEVMAVARRGLLLSHDGGKTWHRATLPPVSILTDAALDNLGNMFFSSREGAFRSSNNGATWSRLNRVPVVNLNAITWDASTQRMLISSSNSSDLYESRDAGDHWRALPVGWAVKAIRVAGERAFATTQFDGIVANIETESAQSASRALAGGGKR